MAADDENKKRINDGLGYGMPEAVVAPGMPPGSVLLIVPPEDACDLDEFGRWWDGVVQGGHAVLVKNVGEGESVEVGDGDEDVGGEDRSDRRPIR